MQYFKPLGTSLNQLTWLHDVHERQLYVEHWSILP